MVRSQEYRAIQGHRTAALAGSRLLAMAESQFGVWATEPLPSEVRVYVFPNPGLVDTNTRTWWFGGA